MGLPWSIPAGLWRGATAVVLATGESLTPDVVAAVSVAHARGGCVAIAVNDAYRVAPWANMLYAADGLWWDVHWPKGAGDFAGFKVTAQPQVRFPVMVVESSGHRGYDERPGFIRTGNNSGYQAIHVAAQMGARKIVVCGIDMQGAHFFGLHSRPLRNTGNFTSYIERFRDLAPPLAARGIDVVNVSPRSALDAFRRGDLATELA